MLCNCVSAIYLFLALLDRRFDPVSSANKQTNKKQEQNKKTSHSDVVIMWLLHFTDKFAELNT